MIKEEGKIPKLVSVGIAIESMGIKRTSFYAEAKKGNIKIKKYGTRSLVSEADIQHWIDSLPEKSEMEGK